MKYNSLVFPILLLAAQFSIAQDKPLIRKLTYIISITDSELQTVKGYLLNMTDSSVKVGHWPVMFGNAAVGKENHKEVNYRQISEITLKRNHGAGRGAWKGAVIGALIGAAAGFIEGGDPGEYWLAMTAGEKALIYGGMGAAAGTGIGALIGALVRKKFIIGGNKEKFDEMKTSVLNKAYGTTN